MREAKARGEIERFPGGRRKRGLPPLSKNRTIRRAQRIIEARVSKGTVVVPVSDQTKAEKLGTATGMALDRVLAFLGEEIDPRAEEKLFALQMSVAQSTISNQIRLEAAALQAAAGGIAGLDDDDLGTRIERKLRLVMAYEAEAEAEAAQGREDEPADDDEIGDVAAAE
jgi:hypothetical protein